MGEIDEEIELTVNESENRLELSIGNEETVLNLRVQKKIYSNDNLIK